MEPVRDLGGKNLSDSLIYVCDKANFEELKYVLEVVRDKPLKSISFTTKSLAAMARHDIKTFKRAEEEEKDVVFTGYVLRKVCYFIGERIKRTLEHLDLEGMPIGKWFTSLSLNTTMTLTTVSLRHTRIGDEGCRKILKHGLSSTITSLDLTGCYITEEGIKSLASLIGIQQDRRFFETKFIGLKHICLDYNQFGDSGASIINDLLMNDFFIISVEMRACNITNFIDFIDLVQYNKMLQVIDLRKNPIPDIFIGEIIKTLIKRHPPNAIKYGWKDKKSLDEYKTINE